MKPKEIISGHIADSIKRALLGESYLDPEVLKINGFATATMRHLFSNLCHISYFNYLEVGTLCGATFVSAFNNNPIHAVGIDNFSQPFDQTEVEKQLRENLNRWKGSARDVQFIDGDCFALNPLDQESIELHRPFEMYYYDGEHSFESQRKALPTFFPYMADRFIHIVDDYQWECVRDGTLTGLQELSSKIEVEQAWDLRGEECRSDDPIWWNGVAIFVISKVKA